MIYLLLSILFSTSILLIFRAFKAFKVNTFYAIVINYFIATVTGLLSTPELPALNVIITSPWFTNGIILGSFFIVLFYIMALTTQRLGASVASIANKMALIIPVIFASLYYGDSMNFIKVLGIIIALIGVYLSAIKSSQRISKKTISLLLIPLILFLGSGFIDTFLKYNQEVHLKHDEIKGKLFTAVTFLTAFVMGLFILLIKKKKSAISTNTVWAGTVLGIINFGSIYFLIETFNQSELESSVVFPINNIGVVLLTSISSWMIFKEHFSTTNKIGIALSCISILLISMSI